MKRTKETNRRYRLHQRIKDEFRYNAKNRTIFVQFDIDELPPACTELKNRFNYSVQTEIY